MLESSFVMTGPCTDILFSAEESAERMTLATRRLDLRCRLILTDHIPLLEAVREEEVVENLQRFYTLEEEKKRDKLKEKPQSGLVFSTKDRINKKRELIASMLQNGTSLSLRYVAKKTRSCLKTVKRVFSEVA